MTRLLALCAGAVQAGAPRAIVFVGRRENMDGRFLGWATPAALLRATLNDKPEYESRYRKARAIANQFAVFGLPASQEWLLPRVPIVPSPVAQPQPGPTPQPVSLHPAVAAHLYKYDSSEAATLAAVLIGELRCEPPLACSNLEEPPDRLTSGRLSQLFDHCLYRDAIDRSWPNEKQISAFLGTTTQYVALVRAGRYEAMLQADLGQRAILRGLFNQSRERSQKVDS